MFNPGETVYAAGPGLGTFVRYEGARSAVVEVRGFEYQVPVDSISPTAKFVNCYYHHGGDLPCPDQTDGGH